MAHTVTKNLFIIGVADSGKTRMVRETTLSRKERLGGFYLEPILSGRVRRGMRMHTFDGQERMLAYKGLKSNLSVGNFGLDLNALENVGVPALKLGLMTREAMIIDEIGFLEGMSERFKETLQEVFDSPKPILATLRPGARPWADQIKKWPDTQILLLSKSNYAAVKAQVRKWLDSHL